MLKYPAVRLFLEKDSHDILTEPENLFEKHLEPVRPGRKYDRKKTATARWQILYTNYC